MKYDVQFPKQNMRFKATFGEVQNISDGGYERGYADGYSAGYNNGLEKGIEQGIEQGEAETLAKLEPLTVTENGTYIPDVGYNEVSVSVTSTALKGIVGRTATVITAEDLAGVEKIGANAFYGCLTLESVTIPDSVTTIGDSAFYNCSSLTSVTIPESVTTIGENAFRRCTSLTSVTIPESVTTIGDSAFHDCGSLASITIPDSAVTLGESIFKYCIKATSVKIGDSITILPYETFCYCRSLEQVTIPSAVITIGGDAFWGCESLADAIIEGDVLKNLDNSTVFHQTPIEAGTGYIYIKPASEGVDEATLVEEYKNATNWTVYAEQIKGYSEYMEEE